MTTQIISIENQKSYVKARRPAIPNFNAIQAHAAAFYSALSAGWKCSCLVDHRVNLRLESRDHTIDDDREQDFKGDPFRVVFHNSGSNLAGKGVPSPPWTWEEADIHVTRQSYDGPQLDLRSSVKGVRFEVKAKKVTKALPGPDHSIPPIHDLCTAISNLRKPEHDHCLSLLTPEYATQKYGVYIYPLQGRPSDPLSYSTSPLRSVLDDPDFSWRDRSYLAIILASSVLQLHNTPWLDEYWGLDSVFFIGQVDQIAYKHPFVSQNFNTANDTFQTNSIPPLVRRIIRNQALYALGVSLIELRYKKSIQELHKPEDGPLSSNDPVATILTQWNTADRLAEKLEGDVGFCYGDAVRRCIRCNFNCKSSCLDEITFQAEVYQGVVSLLQRNYDSFFAPEFSTS